MKKIYILIAMIILNGCATTPKAQLSRFNPGTEPIYPAITVVMTSEELQYFSYRDAFLKGLKEANVFKAIEIDNPYSDFALEVYLETDNKSMDNNVEGFTKAVVAGGSLGLIPVGLEFHTKGRVKLRYLGEVIEEFEINSVYKTNHSILNVESKDAGVFGSYRKVVEQILMKFEETQPFDKLFKEMSRGEEKDMIGI